MSETVRLTHAEIEGIIADAVREAVEPVVLKWACPPLENRSNRLILNDLRDLLARADRIAPTTEKPVHEFTEDVDDGSMCVCGIPALVHDEWEKRGGRIAPTTEAGQR